MSNDAIPPGWTRIDLTVEQKAIMLQAAAVPFNKELTKGARELDKHKNLIRTLGPIVGVGDRLRGNPNVKHGAAIRILEYLLDNGAAYRRIHKKWGPIIDIKLPDGLGARYTTSFRFEFFLGREDD